MIKFEDLKIGDYVCYAGNTSPHKVLAIGPDHIIMKYDKGAEHPHIFYRSSHDPTDWSYYTPPKQKKVKLMSPAVWRDCTGIFSISDRLHSSEEEANKYCTYVHSWPAKDAQGNAIEIAVEVEE